MTFIRVPNSLLSMAGMVSICEPTPEPPTVNSFSNTSFQDLILDACQAMQIAVLASKLPIQCILRGSNFAPLMPNNGANGTLECTRPSVVPSRGATDSK